MSLMKMRQASAEEMRAQWPLSLFRGRPSVAKVVGYSALAMALGGLSLVAMIGQGNAAADVGLLFSAVIALAAHAQWLRLKEARERLLPERFLCTSCEGPIVLSVEERHAARFACPACGEDFEVVDEKATDPAPSPSGRS